MIKENAHLVKKLSDAVLEKETLDVLGIIDVLGHRPYPYPENIQKYINETKKQTDEKNKKMSEETNKLDIIDTESKTISNNNNDNNTTISEKNISNIEDKNSSNDNKDSNKISINGTKSFFNRINLRRSFYFYKREYIKGLKLIYRMILKHMSKLYKLH